jgi:hypothetical protein
MFFFGLIFCFLEIPHQLAEIRALNYLIREVPAWSKENKCFSCHNNGDGARTLYLAKRLGRTIPEDALEDTANWLCKPKDWSKSEANARYSDKLFDLIQFSAALQEAHEAEILKTREPLLEACELLVLQQNEDGSWRAGIDGSIGSPVTQGPTLATVQARMVLQRVDARKFKEAIARGDEWLWKKRVRSIMDASAILLWLEKSKGKRAEEKRKECLELIRKGESEDGGWGPYVNAGPEVFDTSLVILALGCQPETSEVRVWIQHGRVYLIRTQHKDGYWPETTRPSGAESYAQRISTTAWAVRALIISHR